MPQRTLDAISGARSVKTWLRQDIALWEKGDVEALAEGYLISWTGRHGQELSWWSAWRAKRACRW